MKLIDKNSLLAEIEKCVDRCNEKKRSCPVNTQVEAICDNKINAYNEIISHLNTFEVKEVDIEKELVDYHNENFSPCNDGTLLSCETGSELTWYDYESIAKHFFELGLKVVQKGEIK